MPLVAYVMCRLHGEGRAVVVVVVSVMAGFRARATSGALVGGDRSQQQPPFRVLDVSEYTGIYPSIPNHHFAELL